MKKIHFMGVGGSGMNAVCGIAHFLGYEVSGCDFAAKTSEYVKPLTEKGIQIFDQHSAEHLDGIDILCVTPAVFDQSENHPEYKFAKESGITIMTWQQFMGMELHKHKKVIAVAGTKGKSTTTALIGKIFENAGLDPIVQVGAKVKSWGQNYRTGHGEWFICEADEYYGSFLHYSPNVAVITNIELDHPEYFPSEEAYVDVYMQFVKQIAERGFLVLGDVGEAYQNIEEIIANKHIDVVRSANHLGVLHYKAPASLPGKYNALNIAAAFAVSAYANIPDHIARETVEEFEGLGRRFELICEKKGVKIYNDYAHNPMSVKAVLTGARERFPEARIWAIFQPHMYTRTKLFIQEFAECFESADMVVISKIFASREAGKSVETEVNGQMLVDRILAVESGKNVIYKDTFEDLVEYVLANLSSNDVVVNMGAGDNGIICELLCERLSL
jgi:UDP-N-acetylmuramate--alanine ligase